MAEHQGDEELDGIAIVGMGGRFPGARNIDELRRDFRAGVDRVVTFTEAEMLAAGARQSDIESPRYVPAGAPLEDIDLFDAPFFGVSPREAEAMDPQHRLFLEVAWEAFERAGHDPGSFPGLVGVFAGSSASGYQRMVFADASIVGALGTIGVMHGTEKDHLTARVSYKLDLRGPCVCVQTACSTSLVAICLACQSLLDHECDMALAGGVGVNASQRAGYEYREGGLASPDGRCRAFDAAAAGSVWGNGLGVLVLRRLADALADGDHVHAVLKGACLNNDGSRKVGYTAPSVDGIADVVAAAQALAMVEPDDIGFVVAHGTGTPLGDTAEVAALTRVFRAKTQRRQFCALGSSEPNIGHLDAASGVASLLRGILAVEHGELPPNLHYERANPALALEQSPFYVNTVLRPWPVTSGPRRAGVNSLGIGGTNAHVIVEQAPSRPPSGPARSIQILTLSARSEAALERAVADLADYLARHPEVPLADVAYTGHIGRRAFPFRRAFIGRDRAALLAALTAPSSSERVVVASAPGHVEDAELARIQALGQVWAGGGEVDWVGFHRGETRRRVPLPTYPFERRRYWVSPRASSEAAGASVTAAGDKHPRPALCTEYMAPATEDERRVAGIWGDLLGMSEVGIHDNFLELGGHSLLATRVLAWVREEMGVEVPLVSFFEEPTVAALARRIEAIRAGGQGSAGNKIPRARRERRGNPA